MVSVELPDGEFTSTLIPTSSWRTPMLGGVDIALYRGSRSNPTYPGSTCRKFARFVTVVEPLFLVSGGRAPCPGPIPDTLGHLAELRGLHLHDNNLSGI